MPERRCGKSTACDEQGMAEVLTAEEILQLTELGGNHASFSRPARRRRSVSSRPRIRQISTAPPGVTSLPAAAMHHTKMNHKKQRQFPDAVFVFSDTVHAFRIPGVKSFLSLCLIISIITRAIITEQMSAIGCAKIRPSSPTNALAINSTGRKTNP